MVILDSYTEDNAVADAGNSLGVFDKLSGPFFRGQSFTSTGGFLRRVSFYLKRLDGEDPQGNMYATIHAHTGTFGTSSVGVGPALSVSLPVSASILDVDFALVNFDFAEMRQINLPEGNYMVSLHYSSPGRDYNSFTPSTDDTVGVYLGYDNTSPGHEGNSAFQGSTSDPWTSVDTIDLIFYVYVEHPFQQQSPGAQLDASSLIDSYPESNQDGTNYLNWSGNYAYYGQSFDSGVGGLLSSCKFYLKKNGTLTGTMNAQLYAHSGTYGTSSVGTTLLATSDNLVANSAITTSFQLVEFFFTGVNQYPMAANTKYCIVFKWGLGDASNNIVVGTDNSSPTHAGQLVRYNDIAWDNEVVDCIFYVYKTAAGVPGGSSQNNLNRLAGTSGLSSQDAANTLAGTTGNSIQKALGVKYSKSGSTQEIINQQINDGTVYIIHDGLSKL